MPSENATFRTYDLVPARGTYGVHHTLHTLQETVALFKGEHFPSCANCNSPVCFVLVRAVLALDLIPRLEIRVPLLTLRCAHEATALASPAIEPR